jgi:hypothetical protein
MRMITTSLKGAALVAVAAGALTVGVAGQASAAEPNRYGPVTCSGEGTEVDFASHRADTVSLAWANVNDQWAYTTATVDKSWYSVLNGSAVASFSTPTINGLDPVSVDVYFEGRQGNLVGATWANCT